MPKFPKNTTKLVNKRFEEWTSSGLEDHKNTNTDKPMSHEKIHLINTTAYCSQQISIDPCGTTQ